MFEKLRKAIVAYHEKEKERMLEDLGKNWDTSDIEWRFRNAAHKRKRVLAKYRTKDEKLEFIKQECIRQEEQFLQDDLRDLDLAEQAPDITWFKVTIEWKRSRMWGMNPTAEMCNGNTYLKGKSIGGCGYDKESTAAAEVMNHPDILKILYAAAEELGPEESFRSTIGYGSGSRPKPRFDGGVGMNCFVDIFRNLGWDVSGDSGSTFNVYRFTKKENKNGNG